MNERLDKFEGSSSKINDKLDELRLQIGIMNARFPQTIHMLPPVQQTEKPIYTGAKRGPKPKEKNPAQESEATLKRSKNDERF